MRQKFLFRLFVRPSFGATSRRGLSSSNSSSPAFPTQLFLGDEIDTWKDLGFNVTSNGTIYFEEMAIHLCGKSQGRGILGWNFQNIPSNIDKIDGIPIIRKDSEFSSRDTSSLSSHPNGVQIIDHFVIRSKNYTQTENEFKSFGILLKNRFEKEPEAGKKLTYSFYRPSQTILEVISPSNVDDLPSRSSSTNSKIIGISFSCPDLFKTQSYLSKVTKPPWAAVQKNRQITTLNKDLVDHNGEKLVSIRIAFMSPHVK